MKLLKKYDKFLLSEKKLDGTTIISRQSPFSATTQFKVLEIQNQFIGSGLWLLRKLSLMDTQKNDLIGKTAQNNLKLRNKKDDDRISREIVEFIHRGGESFIN